MNQLIAPSRMKLNVQELADRDETMNFADLIHKAIGNLDDYTVLGSDVLVATYIKPRKTAGGILLPDKSVEEDRWQGKAGLVLKLGESAFKYDGPYDYKGTVPKPGDYIAFHTSDSREMGICGVSCRIIDSQFCRMIVKSPDRIY